MFTKEILLLLSPLVLIICGQLAARQGAVLAVSGLYPGFNIFHLLSYFFLFARGPLWLLVLKRFSLSKAYPVLSLNYVILLFISAAVFHESVTPAKAAGAVLVTAGVMLVMKSRDA